MTIRRGHPDGSIDTADTSDGWYHQLRGDKEWTGPFPTANDAQAAHRAAKKARAIASGSPGATPAQHKKPTPPPTPRKPRASSPTHDAVTHDGHCEVERIGRCGCAKRAELRTKWDREAAEAAEAAAEAAVQAELERSPAYRARRYIAVIRKERASQTAKDKLQFWRGVVIAIVVAAAFWVWASNRDPGPTYATERACLEEHTLCDYREPYTEKNPDGYTKHRGFWFPVDPGYPG